MNEELTVAASIGGAVLSGGFIGGLVSWLVAKRESRDRREALELERQKWREAADLERLKFSESLRQSRLAATGELVKRTHLALGKLSRASGITNATRPSKYRDDIRRDVKLAQELSRTREEIEQIRNEWLLHPVDEINTHIDAISRAAYELSQEVTPLDDRLQKSPSEHSHASLQNLVSEMRQILKDYVRVMPQKPQEPF